MKLDQLSDLYKDMKSKEIGRTRFSFSFRSVQFEVIYFIDDKPHFLAVGVRKQNFYFIVTVEPGFYIKPWIDNLDKFYRVMGFEYDPDHKFRPSVFFQELNTNIPAGTSHKQTPSPQDIAYYRKPTEEPDKIYFDTWRDNDKRGHQVSPENLEKTRILISYEAYCMCDQKNISSVWTSDPNKANETYLPF